MDTADPTEVSVAVLSTSAKLDSGVEFASLPPASLSSCCNNNIFFNCFGLFFHKQAAITLAEAFKMQTTRSLK
jgi:hypothetical protein